MEPEFKKTGEFFKISVFMKKPWRSGRGEVRSLEKEARLRRVQEGGPAPKWDTREAEGMAASATSAALFGGGLGFLTQVYSNAVRQLPVLRSKTPSHETRDGRHTQSANARRGRRPPCAAPFPTHPRRGVRRRSRARAPSVGATRDRSRAPKLCFVDSLLTRPVLLILFFLFSRAEPWEHGLASVVGAGFGLAVIDMEERLRVYIEEQTQARSRK